MDGFGATRRSHLPRRLVVAQTRNAVDDEL